MSRKTRSNPLRDYVLGLMMAKGYAVADLARKSGRTRAAVSRGLLVGRLEDKLIRHAAKMLDADADELYRLSGRVPPDLLEALIQYGRYGDVRGWVRRAAAMGKSKRSIDHAIDGWCLLCECPGGAHEEACDVVRLEAALLGDGHG